MRFWGRSKEQKLGAKEWREIYWNKAKAKEALINLMVPVTDGKFGTKLSPVKFVDLMNGSRIPVADVTEEQAHEFMKALCPTWAHATESVGE